LAGGSDGTFQQLSRVPVADEFEIATKLAFAPYANFQFAGLTVDQDFDD
jgi:hypothetical protein